MHNKWRRFLPKKRMVAVLEDGSRLSTIRSYEQADEFIERLRKKGEPSEPQAKQEYLRALLIAQTPRAAKAQIEMDRHKHGYHHREKRLYELIDFNDTFVSYVLATPHRQLPGLAERLHQDMVEFCRRLGTTMLTDVQFEAITKGLSREIAVYRGALHQGFKARMTSRSEDAFGIDMVITDTESGKQLNIDCKTPSAFRHRLEDLVKEGRLEDDDVVIADEQGYVTIAQYRNNEAVPVTLFCILPDRLGEIVDFTFDDTSRLKVELDRMFTDR